MEPLLTEIHSEIIVFVENPARSRQFQAVIDSNKHTTERRREAAAAEASQDLLRLMVSTDVFIGYSIPLKIGSLVGSL